MTGLTQDLRFALRQLGKNPRFTLIAALTLAIGIGASTAIFSVVNTVLLNPLPYRDPERLVLVTESLPAMSSSEVGVSAQEYIDYRDRNRSFDQVAAYERAGFNLTGAGRPLRVNAASISASAFPLLGVSPELGHVFTDGDRPGSPHVVLLSHSLWQNEYGADRNIIGKSVKLDEESYTVLGVMPPSFRFPFDGAPLSEMADLWVPDVFSPHLLAPENRTQEFGVGLIARLKPGVSKEQAQQDISGIAHAFMQQYSQYSGTVRVQPKVYPFAAHALNKAQPLLLLLALAVACVLLISCANVANLLLARASPRAHEMAVRAALGASRPRILRQCLVESLLLSLIGAIAATLIAAESISALRRFGPSDVPRLYEVALHPTALVFALLLSVAVAVLFGFAPAWRLSHIAPHEAVKESKQVGIGHSSQRLQNSVVVTEIAATVVLLIAGGLLIRSFVRLLNSPFGFDPNNTFLVRTLFDGARYPDPLRRMAVQQSLLENLRQLPGVTAVGAASHLPLSDTRQIGFRLEHSSQDDYRWAENSLVSPGYFNAMGISLIKGTDFHETDRTNLSKINPDRHCIAVTCVAIVSETFAKKFLPGQNPIGQRFEWGGDGNLFTIIGVAADVHISALDADPPPMIYFSIFQVKTGGGGRTAFVLRADQPGQILFKEVQQTVWAVDKDLPVYNTSSMASLVAESIAQRRFAVLLLGSFGGVALLLAAIGLFGVVSCLVVERTHEFGVRMALGAERKDIYSQVLRRAATLSCAGCLLGLLGSVLVSSFLQASLYRVNRFDLVTLVLTPVLLLSVALFAAYWPARRAAKVDPMAALRYE